MINLLGLAFFRAAFYQVLVYPWRQTWRFTPDWCTTFTTTVWVIVRVHYGTTNFVIVCSSNRARPAIDITFVLFVTNNPDSCTAS